MVSRQSAVHHAMATSSGRVDQVTDRRRTTGLIAHDPERSAGGYTLVAPQTADGNVYLVAMDGTIAHQWHMPQRPGRHAVILPNGNLGYNGNHRDTQNLYPAWEMWHGGAFSEVTPSGRYRVESFEDKRHHHDGAMAAQRRPALHDRCKKCRPLRMRRASTGGSHAHDLPNGTAIRRCGASASIAPANARLAVEIVGASRLRPTYPIHPIFDRYHWPLINGVFRHAQAGSRPDEPAYDVGGRSAVDPATAARSLWRIDASRCSRSSTRRSRLPKTVTILAFDNGNLAPGRHVAALARRRDSIRRRAKRRHGSIPIRCARNFSRPIWAVPHRLANGNTLICESAFGRLFEVTPAGETVWEYIIPFFDEYPAGAARDYSAGASNSVFKSYRYPKAAIPWL